MFVLKGVAAVDSIFAGAGFFSGHFVNLVNTTMKRRDVGGGGRQAKKFR